MDDENWDWTAACLHVLFCNKRVDNCLRCQQIALKCEQEKSCPKCGGKFEQLGDISKRVYLG